MRRYILFFTASDLMCVEEFDSLIGALKGKLELSDITVIGIKSNGKESIKILDQQTGNFFDIL